jgi:predicted ATPase
MVGRISSPRFVGRVAELDVLQRALARASSGTGTAVLIAGEAGIGKSRLVSEFEERARAREALVLIGECVELAEGELAFAPIISALRGVVEDGRALEGIEGPMRSALAVLWPVAGADEGVDTGRERLFEAVYRVLARLAREQAVLLIIEDVHWIDPSSRDLLAFLVRNARRDRIAVVATYRPDELGTGHALTPFVAELERSGRAERLELEPLARREVAEQLEAISGRVPTVAALERIFVRCEGNPFFAEELLASAGAVGGELPVSLRQALLLRVERVSEVTREVLRVAAVVGRSVDHRLLADVVGVGERELLVALREATDYHVLVPSASGVAYTFRHALLREAIYTDTLIGERLRLHRGIAEALESSREYALAGAAAELAYHWLAAGDERAGLAACVEAAGEAERMHAHGEAANHIDRVLELWDRVESPDEVAGCDRVDLLLRGSEFADFSGDAEHGLALAERARGHRRAGRSAESCCRGGADRPVAALLRSWGGGGRSSRRGSSAGPERATVARLRAGAGVRGTGADTQRTGQRGAASARGGAPDRRAARCAEGAVERTELAGDRVKQPRRGRAGDRCRPRGAADRQGDRLRGGDHACLRQRQQCD